MHNRCTCISAVFLLTVFCVFCIPSGGNGATIPSDQVIPRFKEIGESLAGGIKGECQEVFVTYLEIFKMYAEDIKAEFSLEKGRELLFSKIKGSFYGGIISGSVRVVLGKKVSYRVELTFSSVDFQWFAMNFFDPGTEFKGKVRGSLSVSGNDEGEVHGTLNLYLKNGYIARLPRWFTMFSLMDVNPIGSQKVSEAKIKLALDKDKFKIRSCLLKTDDITITGSGEITFDGEANIVLNPRGEHPLLSLVPIVGPFVKWLEKMVWRITIKGPIFAPQYNINPLYKL